MHSFSNFYLRFNRHRYGLQTSENIQKWEESEEFARRVSMLELADKLFMECVKIDPEFEEYKTFLGSEDDDESEGQLACGSILELVRLFKSQKYAAVLQKADIQKLHRLYLHMKVYDLRCELNNNIAARAKLDTEISAQQLEIATQMNAIEKLYS